LLLIRHRKLPKDAVVVRVETNRLFVVLDGAGNVHLDGLVARIRQINGLDVVATAAYRRYRQ
jgi:hypothetical protein